MTRGRAVGIVTGYGLDCREVGVRVPVGPRILTSPYRPDRIWAHSTFYPIGTGAFSSGAKRPVHKAGHSPPTSVEITKTRIYASPPPYALTA
jgi:hypothetical protein